jgi:TRAP-type C4-dicarboxylate transport system substrate-binding protein
MYFGGIAANADFWNTLPAPVQAAFRDAAKVTSKLHGDYVASLAERALTEMQAAGLTVAELPEADKQAWVAGLPDIVEPWLAQTGDAGSTVLRAYFDALKAAGVTPLRDWTAGR